MGNAEQKLQVIGLVYRRSFWSYLGHGSFQGFWI